MASDGRMTAEVKVGSSCEAGIPHALFDSQMFGPTVQLVFRYDVSGDGQRFLVKTTRQGGGRPT